MDNYYALRYKSSPEGTPLILHKLGNTLEIVGSSISPKRMGIKLDDKGEIILPSYFFPLSKVDKNFVFNTISKKMDNKIERLLNSD